jgi:peptidyl-prolyl cis-trans isomerase C
MTRSALPFLLLATALGTWACEDETKPATGAGGSAASAKPAASGALARVEDPAFDSALSPDERKQVVATIGEMSITLGEFERRLNQQAPYARARYNSLERKKEFLDNLVRFEVLAAEASRKGYDRDSDVVQQMKQTMVRKLMTREVSNLVKLADISDADMQAYYKEESKSYHKPEQVRVSHVLIADKGRALKMFAGLKKSIKADRRNYRKIFADFARESSEDTDSRARGGDLRFFPRTEQGGEKPQALSDGAFALQKVGDLSKPVKTDKGWHLLLLTGRKNPYDRTFEQVKRQIQNRLYRKQKRAATDKFVADLKAKARVNIEPEHLDKIKVPVGGKAPPGIAPGVVRPKPGVLGPIDAVAPPGGGRPVGNLDGKVVPAPPGADSPPPKAGTP